MAILLSEWKNNLLSISAVWLSGMRGLTAGNERLDFYFCLFTYRGVIERGSCGVSASNVVSQWCDASTHLPVT